MKREKRMLDGTPSKWSFWAIVNDYDLQTSICELIDNALDLYLKGKQLIPVSIRVNLNIDRQTASIEDTAGGVAEKEAFPGYARGTVEDAERFLRITKP